MNGLVSFGLLDLLWSCAVLITTFVSVASYRLSSLIQRRLASNMPFVCLSATSGIFRLRDGMRWEYGSFQITPKKVLKHWNGLLLGRSPLCRLQAYTAEGSDAADISSVSRCHARLDFDTTEQEFYIENCSAGNSIYLLPLDTVPSEPELLVERMYLTQDTRLLLGNIPLTLCVCRKRNDEPEQPENTLGAGAVVLLQLLAFIFCARRTDSITFALCVPWLLLAVTAIQTLPRGGVPVLGTFLTVLTYAGGWYIIFSSQPDTAARMFSRLLFCLGAAIIAAIPYLAKGGREERRWSTLWKLIFTVLLVLILFHFEIISPVDDVIFLLVLIFGTKRS